MLAKIAKKITLRALGVFSVHPLRFILPYSQMKSTLNALLLCGASSRVLSGPCGGECFGRIRLRTALKVLGR